MTVKVNADNASILDVEAKTETNDVVFTNYYKARGEKSITGSKELTYRLPEDEEFEFVISGKDGEIARVKSLSSSSAARMERSQESRALT